MMNCPACVVVLHHCCHCRLWTVHGFVHRNFLSCTDMPLIYGHKYSVNMNCISGHLVLMPNSLCNHELSVMYCHCDCCAWTTLPSTHLIIEVSHSASLPLVLISQKLDHYDLYFQMAAILVIFFMCLSCLCG